MITGRRPRESPITVPLSRLIPIQIAVFIAYPYPKTVAGWYMLLQDKPLAGLVDLDLVLVVDNVLLVVNRDVAGSRQ